MKICLVQSRPDRTVGKHVPCGEPAVFKIKYKQFLHYPAHTSYMCFKHGEMAAELVKVDKTMINWVLNRVLSSRKRLRRRLLGG